MVHRQPRARQTLRLRLASLTHPRAQPSDFSHVRFHSAKPGAATYEYMIPHANGLQPTLLHHLTHLFSLYLPLS